MQYVAHKINTPPGDLYGRGPTPEAAMAAAKAQFIGAMEFWPSVRAKLILTEMPDDFRGTYE
jgi:hypothetical protein